MRRAVGRHDVFDEAKSALLVAADRAQILRRWIDDDAGNLGIRE